MAKKPSKLLVVMPCYNEEEILPATADRMEKLLEEMVKDGLVAADSRVCLVNDGSKDQTWEVIKKICGEKKYFTALTLSRNFGQQAAILAGLFDNEADLYVTIDADLQDDPEIIKEMLTEAEKGCDIVYGVRDNRDSDGFFKKYTALGFYKLMQLLGVYLR